MFHQPSAGLDQALLQTRQRPVPNLLRQTLTVARDSPSYRLRLTTDALHFPGSPEKSIGTLTHEIEHIVQNLQRHLGVPVEAMEDALCNWQKKLIPEPGYLSLTCR